MTRPPAPPTQGMVATSTPDAAAAGAATLRRGGNAVDAAVATAAAAAVVEPCSNGFGGDVAALVWFDGTLHGINGTGAYPRDGTASDIDSFGPSSITVPGGIGTWAALHERFGVLTLQQVLEPAVDLADNGFELTESTAAGWRRGWEGYRSVADRRWFAEWTAEFGAPPAAGDVRRSSSQAGTLRQFSEVGLRDFYHGELAHRIADTVRRHGGTLSTHDLESYAPEWVTPISVAYHGHDVWGLPPNIQGTVALQALGMLDSLDVDIPSTHQAIEAVKLAFADTDRYLGDSHAMTVTADDLLDPAYLAKRATRIGNTARVHGPGRPPNGGTIYLATSDRHGNSVSLLQSNYRYFGSGVVVPGTGIALHNRASAFDSGDGRPNSASPGRRPRHTIVPGFVTEQGRAVGPLGVMGAAMQPQGQVQLLTHMIDDGATPQQALNRPRWKWTDGNTVHIEHDFPPESEQDLMRRGHLVTRLSPDLTGAAPFGRGQIIHRTQDGVVRAGTDPRVDGAIASC